MSVLFLKLRYRLTAFFQQTRHFQNIFNIRSAAVNLETVIIFDSVWVRVYVRYAGSSSGSDPGCD